MKTELFTHSHRRRNPLTGEWILVSPHRASRPWQGQVEPVIAPVQVAHDDACYLCSGNKRAGGEQNPYYQSTFAFTNDFAALQPVNSKINHESPLYTAESESGICRVLCFSPRHDLTMAQMSTEQIEDVVDLWVEEYSALAGNTEINYVQLFENKGEMMGCSNPHPHGQIWAQHTIPSEIAKKTTHQQEYFATYGQSLLSDYVKSELEQKERVVYTNDHFAVLVPFWAVWPFESMIVPLRKMAFVDQMTGEERTALAEAIRSITCRYDNLFNCSFPYSAGFHQAPCDGQEHESWHWHMSFYPPLLRSATVKKFMVGYEMFAGPQRDITPESSAKALKGRSDVHFSHRVPLENIEL